MTGVMAEQTAEFMEWIRLLSPFWSYIILLVIAWGENVIPPIPGDLVIVFSGYLAATGQLNLILVVLIATVGGAIGFMTMFIVGRAFGDAAMDPDRLQWLPKRRIHRARSWLLKWGYALVGANRFLSGLRSVISFTVGAAKMNTWKTAVFATFSALVWTSLIAYLGSVIGDNWDVVTSIFRSYGKAVTTLVITVVVLRIGWGWWQKFRDDKEPFEPPNSPGINDE